MAIKTGTRDFLNKQGIINLADASGVGQPIVHGQVIPLKSIAYASLPVTGIPNRGMVYVPDHPIEGKTVVFWDGTVWIAVPRGVVSIPSTTRAIISSGTTSPVTIGISLTTVGTFAAIQPAATSVYTRANRTTMTTAATAGSMASFRSPIARNWGGSAIGEGGWDLILPFGGATLVAGMRCFLGLDSNTSAATNLDPVINSVGGKVGVAINSNTGNWNLINNVQGTIPTVLSLSNCPIDNTSWYQLRLYRSSFSSPINYEVINRTTNVTVSGTLTTNVPVLSQYLTLNCWATNNATAAATAIAFGDIRLDWGA
jgi:hypothetical protein